MRLAMILPASGAALVALTLAVAAVLPSSYELSRETVIARPASELSGLVADFSTRTRWIPWQETEATAGYTVAGRPGTLGSTFSWNGSSIGEGRATLTQHRPGVLVETALDFARPMAMQSTDAFKFEAIDATHTRVTWSNRGALPYPAGRLFGLVIDRVVGADYSKGLEQLRAFAESSPQAARPAVAPSAVLVAR